MISMRSFVEAIKPWLARIRSGLAMLWWHVRHPTRRGVMRLLCALLLAFPLYVLILIPFTPSISDIRKATSERPAQILFADGKVLTEFKQSNREWVTLSGVSPLVVDALIATEDQRFYQHHGLDWRRLVSSLYYTFTGNLQGGSTLTQQLARNLYPDEIGRSRSLTRKLKEAITALKIEAVHSKDEILETYLNTVPFLYNAYGIEMAARTYFDTSADKLDVLESATLVGMLKGNSYYNPVLNPERALQRRNTVLAQMVKRQKLTETRFEALKKKPLGIDFERQSESLGSAPHFAVQLRKWLIAWADDNDYNLYRDGLVVRTTLDSRLQVMADQAVMRQGEALQQLADQAWAPGWGWSGKNELVQAFVRESAQYRASLAAGMLPEQAMKKWLADKGFMQNLRQQKIQLQAGFLAIDPRNGHIKAWVGGRDFGLDGYDHVQQARRQPGSTFKPFVYGEAFRQGMTPDDTLIDQSVEIKLGPTETWRPSDGKPASDLPISLRSALAYSKNTITAQLMQKVGPANVIKLARALGVRESKLENVLSLALGTSPVTLKEMVTAYGSIANGGRYLAPVMVTQIEDGRGKVLEAFAPAKPESALDQNVAYTLLDVMRGVVDRGTGSAIRYRYGIYADVAGKTGTTQDNADGWFILMHPQLVSGAWVGFNDSRVTLRSDYWGQGAHSALPIVGEFFRSALRNNIVDAQAHFGTPEQQAMARLPKPTPASEPAEQASEVAASSPDQEELQQQIPPGTAQNILPESGRTSPGTVGASAAGNAN